ncbi:MAG: thioredoxin domain-containing protein [Acidimicrobiales bacterium]
MERLVLAVVLIGVAAVVAAVIGRRRPDAPTQPVTYRVPSQLDRADFARADAPWLVVVFTAATCGSCRNAWEKAQPLESSEVAVEEAEVTARADLHQRYGIDGVPLTLIADHEGVVRASFVGPATATDLWATVAELREPGSVPEGCDHGQGAGQTADPASSEGAPDPG